MSTTDSTSRCLKTVGLALLIFSFIETTLNTVGVFN
jgi:hypothetical protein